MRESLLARLQIISNVLSLEPSSIKISSNMYGKSQVDLQISSYKRLRDSSSLKHGTISETFCLFIDE